MNNKETKTLADYSCEECSKSNQMQLQDSTSCKYKRIGTLVDCIVHQVNALKRKKYNKKWLTNNDIRDLLGISDRLIKKYRDSGILKYSQEGNTYWYSREDVENFLNKTHYL